MQAAQPTAINAVSCQLVKDLRRKNMSTSDEKSPSAHLESSPESRPSDDRPSELCGFRKRAFSSSRTLLSHHHDSPTSHRIAAPCASPTPPCANPSPSSHP